MIKKSEIDQIAEMLGGLATTMGESVKEQTEILRGLSETIRAQSTGQVQQVNIPQQNQIPPLIGRMERLVWAMAFTAALAVLIAFFQGQRVTDMRIDMQADRARSEAHAAWAREEAQIVRGYIWKGVVPRINQYPQQESKK